MPERILFLAHTETDGSLGKAALDALDAAHAFDGELMVGLMGARVKDTVPECGAVRFLAVENEALSQPRYATDAAAAEALCRATEATIIVAPQTSRFARALPGAAYRLDGRADTHVCSLTAGAEATRWYYRQRIEATLQRAQRPWFLLVEGGAPFNGASHETEIERIPIAVTAGMTRTNVAGIVTGRTDQQTIRPDAKLLFVAGAGWTKRQADGQTHADEATRLILDFLENSQASLGSSKSLVDQAGEGHSVLPFLSHLNQVGQTGATPRHPKGLSTCCHGEEPHVVGWRFVRERRAVNLDANCGWARGKADVLYVADAFEVIKRVNEILASRVAQTLSNQLA